MKQLSLPQKKAIVALVLLARCSRQAGFARWDIGKVSKQNCSSYPVKTMRAIQRAGLCEPVCDVALELVENGLCRCGCDLWKPTEQGRKYVESLKVVGQMPRKRRQLSNEEIRQRIDGIFGGDSGPQEGWKQGKEPPEFDPNSPSQRPESHLTRF